MVSTPINTNIINHWKAKGMDDSNTLADEFICYWISLNAWYGSNLLIGKRRPNEREYIDALAVALANKHIDWADDIKIAQSLNPKLKNIRYDNEEISVLNFTDLVNFIYVVRNNLFHGGKMETEERDGKVLSIATPILRKILDATLEI